jgi:hypothetical protein
MLHHMLKHIGADDACSNPAGMTSAAGRRLQCLPTGSRELLLA